MTIRRTISGLGVALVLSSTFVTSAYAEEKMTLVLEPHCTETDRTKCPQFSVQDAEHLITSTLNTGDILDLDVVLLHGAGQKIQTVRSWLKYDVAALEARSIELTTALPQGIPGEQSIDPATGFVKIGGSMTSPVSSPRIAIARVTFRVLRSTKNTEISFADMDASGLGRTAINGLITQQSTGGLTEPPCIGDFVLCQNGTTAPLLEVQPSTLIVQFSPLNSSTSLSTTGSSIPTQNQTGNSMPPMQNAMGTTQSTSGNTPSVTNTSSFPLLQVQTVRVTSQDRSIFLGWQSLRSSELAGYNVYYGTVSGKYLQRRSLPTESTSLVLRDLEPGVTYYLAVRGYNKADQESVFSQEVSVIVGKPETSSAPLRITEQTVPLPDGNPIERHNGQEINGSTGTGSTMLMLAILCGFIGTAFAAHRQYTLSSPANSHA